MSGPDLAPEAGSGDGAPPSSAPLEPALPAAPDADAQPEDPPLFHHPEPDRPAAPLSGDDDRSWRPGGRLKDSALAIALLAPSAAIFGWFFFYPLYRLVHLALYQQNRFGTAERYVGPSQITSTLTGETFTSGLKVTLGFVALTVPAGIVLGTLLAVAAHRRLRRIRVFQVIFSSTIASSSAVAAVVFFVLINPQAGYFKDVTFISLADPATALRGVALSAIWQNLGLTFVIVLAGLQAVPDEILEAATLDGFGPIRRFFRVTVPLISPTLLFLAIVLVIFAFQAFAQVDILTNGGPARSTQTLVFQIFHSQEPQSQSEGAVMALGLFTITLFVTLGQFLILERRVHYGD